MTPEHDMDLATAALEGCNGNCACAIWDSRHAAAMALYDEVEKRQQAEATTRRLRAALEAARTAVDDAARIRVAGATEMGQYVALMDAMAILDAAIDAERQS